MSTFSRITCPTAIVCALWMKFRRRNSSGASPTASATRSRWRSSAKTLCGAPNPRKAPWGGAFVATARLRIAHVRASIRPRRVNRAARKHHRRERFVRAAVDREIDVHRQKFSVARHRRAMPRARRMPLRRRHHIFGAVVNNFHGLARISTPAAPRGRDHRRIFFLAAKSSAGFGLHHANFFLRQAEQAASAPCARNRGTAASPTP